MLAIALVVVALDQLSKWLILATQTPGVPTPVIGDFARLYLTFNSGAAFSMGSGHTWIFTLIQAAFVIGVAIASRYITSPANAIGAALIAGGAAGNLIDRLFRAPSFGFGHVVDFISIGNFAIFNVADSAITCGAALLVLLSFIGDKKHPSDTPGRTTKEDTAHA
ncbi:signal peptidase II [Corynebacterium aquilae]|uniref:signal peptidase II n=1 Tax=Corynebacterium aquilae TaxID=203263 RepID=UPI0009531FD3|nr:signal peptidase II [Corynebacterium aquilae]